MNWRWDMKLKWGGCYLKLGWVLLDSKSETPSHHTRLICTTATRISDLQQPHVSILTDEWWAKSQIEFGVVESYPFTTQRFNKIRDDIDTVVQRFLKKLKHPHFISIGPTNMDLCDMGARRNQWIYWLYITWREIWMVNFTQLNDLHLWLFFFINMNHFIM